MSISQDALREDAKVWECLGPVASGGTVFGLAISPVEEVRRCWAASGCGVFRSDDEGQSWVQTLRGLTTPLLSAMTVAHNGALFAGALGGDLFASFDYGATWEAGLVPEESRATVTSLLASPKFKQDGTVFAATDGGGLLVSRSSGKQWEDSSFGLDSETVLALASSPDWSAREVMFAATLEGVFVSRNGGRAWRETGLMLDDDVVDALAVSLAFEQDQTVYAGTEGGRVYRSTDGGRTWDLAGGVADAGPINCLLIVADTGRILAAVGHSLYISDDGGEAWRLATELPGSILTLSSQGPLLMAGLHDAGVAKSVDGGDTWTLASAGLAARGFARLVRSDGRFMAVGPQEGVWISADGAATWAPVRGTEELLPISALAALASGDLLVASERRGILRSSDQGQSWQTVCAAERVQALALVGALGRGWAGTAEGKLWASSDGGATWAEVSSPCEGNEILSLVASPSFEEDHTLFMGTTMAATSNKQARVALWRSTNGGESWRQLTTQTTAARWADIAMPTLPTAAEQAVIATGPYCLRPLRRAKDVWISTTVDPNGANVLSVVALGEVDNGGTLLAATGSGIYRSMDGGRTWQPFSAGLSVESFISLAVRREGESDVLYALSLGGLVWKRVLS